MKCRKCKAELKRQFFVHDVYNSAHSGGGASGFPRDCVLAEATGEHLYYCTYENCEHYGLLKVDVERQEL
jgi:hypothetical protein